jgi:uncharacterized membrane protein
LSRGRQRQRSLARRSAAADDPAGATAGEVAALGRHATPGKTAMPRRIAVDALRGTAICLMIVYHFSFDLRYFHALDADFEHGAFWLSFRALIVTSFMTLVGVSLVLADVSGTSSVKFWKRIGLIAACALAASFGSYLVFPQTYIYFGILHCIAVASVLAWPLVRQPRAAFVAGVAIVVAGVTLSHPAFDHRVLSWLGFTTMKPATEDYVPLAPWTGAVLIGVAVGHVLVNTGFRALGPLAAAPAWLQWLGRHSLAVYMVHQPILLGLLGLVLAR